MTLSTLLFSSGSVIIDRWCEDVLRLKLFILLSEMFFFFFSHFTAWLYKWHVDNSLYKHV